MREIKKIPRFVLQDWIGHLNLKRQTVLLLSLRGPDQGSSVEVKTITKWLRSLCLENADPAKDFMRIELDTVLTVKEIKQQNLFAIDQLPVHFIHHLCDALSTVGYNHPNCLVRGKALNLYTGIAHYVGLLPRTGEQYESRLVDMSVTKSQKET